MTYLKLIPLSRVLLEELTVVELVMKFFAVDGTRESITLFITVSRFTQISL
jgi:hypothetical protein